MNPMENELIMPGIRFGSVTSKNARNGPAPSVAACSSNFSPSAAVTSVIMVMQYGTEATVCISMIPRYAVPEAHLQQHYLGAYCQHRTWHQQRQKAEKPYQPLAPGIHTAR